MSSFHNAMELPGIPDAKEPDGPEDAKEPEPDGPHDEMVGLENDLGGAIEVKLDGDGIVVLENDLGAAIEVTLGQEMKVLYPQKSCGFDITRASDKLMKVDCRDDYYISGTRQVEDGLALRASESFGSFGVEVEDFLQKEQEEVDREKSLLRYRKKRMTWELEKETRARPSILSFVIPLLFSCAALFLGLLVLWTCLDPEDYENSPVLLCLAVVLSLAGLCISSFSAQTFGLNCSGPRQKKLARYGSFACLVLGGLTVIIAIMRYLKAGFWWTVLAAGLPCCCMSTLVCVLSLFASSEKAIMAFERMDEQAVAKRTIVFEGKVLPGTGKCVCSWPGIYQSAWDALVARRRRHSTAVVFLPEGSKDFGSHDTIPEEERLQGSCWCVPLYGEPKPWGCRWWTKWIANIERAHGEGAEMEVYFFKGMKGRGKVKDFSTAGEENLRREAIQAKKQEFFQSQAFSNACDEGIAGLSKDPREDSSSPYSREVQRLFLAWLPEEERHFMEASEGLGNSQKAEVAWLERKGYAYTIVEVGISQWLQ